MLPINSPDQSQCFSVRLSLIVPALCPSSPFLILPFQTVTAIYSVLPGVTKQAFFFFFSSFVKIQVQHQQTAVVLGFLLGHSSNQFHLFSQSIWTSREERFTVWCL